MPYDDAVKKIAQELDPECWVSYSGKDPDFKRGMDYRRNAALQEAAKQFVATFDEVPEPVNDSFLVHSFLQAMNDIGRYGFELYGPLPDKREDHRNPIRVSGAVIAGHAAVHFGHYLCGDLHDHFKTRKHQLAAVAFNAMMEYHFADLENEK